MVLNQPMLYRIEASAGSGQHVPASTPEAAAESELCAAAATAVCALSTQCGSFSSACSMLDVVQGCWHVLSVVGCIAAGLACDCLCHRA